MSLQVYITLIQAHLSQLSPTQIIDSILIFQGIFCFCYFISSCVAFSNEYAGFVGLLTGLIYIASVGHTFYGLKRHLNRTMYGSILGLSSVLVILSLQSAIFWGQYSNCEEGTTTDISNKGSIGVVCTHRGAMKSMCAFSVFMFLTYLGKYRLTLYYNSILCTCYIIYR